MSWEGLKIMSRILTGFYVSSKMSWEKIEKYFFLLATEKCISPNYNGTYEHDMAWKKCNFGIMQQQKSLQY
jgi:hypothetical protein